MLKLIQANVNRSRPSLDLLINKARECDASILLVSEPNHIPDSGNWYGSTVKSSAIFIDPLRIKHYSCPAKEGSRFVAVYCGPYLLISIYVSPRVNARDFNGTLDELSAFLADRTDKIILAGDFNAKASLWSSGTTDRKGLLLSRWAAERDFRILNHGNIPTCVRPQGNSTTDLTWVSSDLYQLTQGWRVRDDWESLSDHLFIEFDIRLDRPRPPTSKILPRKWNAKNLMRISLSLRCCGEVEDLALKIRRMWPKWLPGLTNLWRKLAMLPQQELGQANLEGNVTGGRTR